MFGDALFEDYFKPYNEKVWKVPLKDLSCSMLSRIPVPDQACKQRALNGVVADSYLEQSRFFYPEVGGIQALYDGVSKAASPYNYEKRQVFAEDFFKSGFDGVYSTIPLNEAYELLFSKSSELFYTGLHSMAVTVSGHDGERFPYHWIYEPSSDYSFNRVSCVSEYIAHSKDRPLAFLFEWTTPMGDTDFNITYDQVYEWLNSCFGYDDVNVIDEYDYSYAYPVPTIKNEKIAPERVREIEANCEAKLFGRFATWNYWNMDKILAESKAATADVKQY
jgi:protoporphyrinogen oxidase